MSVAIVCMVNNTAIKQNMLLHSSGHLTASIFDNESNSSVKALDTESHCYFSGAREASSTLVKKNLYIIAIINELH